MAQRSPEWFAARLGKLTGSLAKDATSAPSSAAYQNAKAKLVVERLTGKSAERKFTTAAVEQGKELEPIARALYEARTGLCVQEIGYVDAGAEIGCSPDGVVGDTDTEFEGEVQIKCPQIAAHLIHVMRGIPDSYMPQLLHHFWITGAKWIDFVSYNPEFPAEHQLYVCRLLRPQELVDRYISKARVFLDDVNETVRQLAPGSTVQ